MEPVVVRAAPKKWIFMPKDAIWRRKVQRRHLRTAQKTLWTSPANPLTFPAINMKSDSTNTILIFALGVFAALDVLFAVRTVVSSRQLRTLQIQSQQAQMGMMQIQQLKPVLTDVMAYNQKNSNPELTKILNQAQSKPATH